MEAGDVLSLGLLIASILFALWTGGSTLWREVLCRRARLARGVRRAALDLKVLEYRREAILKEMEDPDTEEADRVVLNIYAEAQLLRIEAAERELEARRRAAKEYRIQELTRG